MAQKFPIAKDIKVGYAAIGVVRGCFYMGLLCDGSYQVEKIGDLKDGRDFYKVMVEWLNGYMVENSYKIVAIGLCGVDDREKLGTRLWQKLDVVPHHFGEVKDKEDLQNICWQVRGRYDDAHRVKVEMTGRRQVVPSYLTDLRSYKKFCTDAEYSGLLELAQEFKDKKQKLVFINATAAGGGVAHMRHGMLRLYRRLGVDVEWLVLKPSAKIFNITKKKFHNVLQAVAPEDCVLTKADQEAYLKWIRINAAYFEPILKKADTVVIDDPQPAGLIPHIKKINPGARILYRSHIQVEAHLIDLRASQQFTTWKFLWQFIKRSELFISHPIPEFVPHTVKPGKLVYMPPSTDPLDGLNKKLKRSQKEYYWSLFNRHLLLNGQKPLNRKRPFMIQVARFDPSKGIFDLIESYRKLYRRLLKGGMVPAKMPQLIIVGNGSVDDPEGVTIYEETRQILRLDTYKHIADNIKVARLPHHDQMLNTLVDDSRIVLQLSHKEGFEFKVTEALMKGKPVVAYKSGGIPLQIRHGRTGFLAPAGHTSQVANHCLQLIQDKPFYQKMSRAAKSHINHDYWTWNNSAKWLYMALASMDKDMKAGQWQEKVDNWHA